MLKLKLQYFGHLMGRNDSLEKILMLGRIEGGMGWEDLLEKEMATHSSVLAWRISWTEEPDRLQIMGSQRVGRDLSDLARTQLILSFTHSFIH